MILTYPLEQEDFLELQLFVASKSSRIRIQRRLTWLLYSLVFGGLGLIFYFTSNKTVGYYFFALAIVTVIFFPTYLGWYYKRHYSRFLDSTIKNRYGIVVAIEINDEFIETGDAGGVSKIYLRELEEIVGTSRYWFLKLKRGTHLIIPKTKIDNDNEVEIYLKTLCCKLGVVFTEDLNWKWR